GRQARAGEDELAHRRTLPSRLAGLRDWRQRGAPSVLRCGGLLLPPGAATPRSSSSLRAVACCAGSSSANASPSASRSLVLRWSCSFAASGVVLTCAPGALLWRGGGAPG